MKWQREGQDNQSSVILSLASTAVILSVECPIGPGHWVLGRQLALPCQWRSGEGQADKQDRVR